jgi:hypothetical protein
MDETSAIALRSIVAPYAKAIWSAMTPLALKLVQTWSPAMPLAKMAWSVPNMGSMADTLAIVQGITAAQYERPPIF